MWKNHLESSFSSFTREDNTDVAASNSGFAWQCENRLSSPLLTDPSFQSTSIAASALSCYYMYICKTSGQCPSFSRLILLDFLRTTYVTSRERGKKIPCWISVLLCFGLNRLSSILSLEWIQATLLGKLIFGMHPRTRTHCQNAFLLKDFGMNDHNKKMLWKRINAVLTEGSWKVRLFWSFSSCGVFTRIQMGVAQLSVNVLILDEEMTSSCSKECTKSTPTLRKSLPEQLQQPGLVCGATKTGKNEECSSQPVRSEFFSVKPTANSFKVSLLMKKKAVWQGQWKMVTGGLVHQHLVCSVKFHKTVKPCYVSFLFSSFLQKTGNQRHC